MTERRPLWRVLALQLALAAMTLQMALPPGWMPSATSGKLVICSLLTGHATAPDAPGAPAKSEHHTLCPFAAVAHNATLGPVQAAPLPFAIAAIARPPSVQTGRQQASFLAAEARAPPRILA